MIDRSRVIVVGLMGLALSGCVAAVPVQPTLTVIPGQGKTEANLRADDAACRVAPAGTAATISESQYYSCMASKGESVVQEQAQAYPAYGTVPYAGVPYVVPAYAAYGYPYGYGYPYYGGYYGPFVGFGVGFGFGHFGYGGYRGFGGYGYRGGYGGGYGGFHGGGFRR